MKERFEGNNRPQLIVALRRQEFACGNTDIAEALAERGLLVEFQPNENVAVQGGTDNDVYFLIAGVVGIIVNGAQIATRKAGQYVGEMAAIEPSLPRSATLLALEKVLALKITSAKFMDLGEKFPQAWLPLARELARRLHQRNTTIWVPNEAPKLFIISSSEAKAIAHGVRAGLEHDVSSIVWDNGVFFAGVAIHLKLWNPRSHLLILLLRSRKRTTL
jgi:CRP/FNR family transcriptional regulator, cyclic AMP receptor protein